MRQTLLAPEADRHPDVRSISQSAPASDRLDVEGSIPSSRCRHHVVRRRATGAVDRAQRWQRPLVVRRRPEACVMNVSQLEWIVTLGITIAVLLFDVVVIARRPHEPTMRECAIYLSIYVALAVAFGIWVWSYHGNQFGVEFFAGWITEYSLSVDNLFIFIIIMASFNVPKHYQQQALLVGIVLALIFRGIFIALGAVAIQQFSWVFYIFGLFLVYTAIHLVRDTDH